MGNGAEAADEPAPAATSISSLSPLGAGGHYSLVFLNCHHILP
jgi:hypothetical protein